jgi:hypothetical protein
MDDQFTQRVRAAAAAGWWTVLIGVIWLTVTWFAFLAIMSYRPEWMLSLWGGKDISWPMMQQISLWLFGVFKLVWFVFLLITLWLTLWSRQLRRANR